MKWLMAVVYDLMGQEAKTKELLTFDEREAYTVAMALIFLFCAVLAFPIHWLLSVAFLLGALRKFWIASKNKE